MEYLLPMFTLILVMVGSIYMTTAIKHDLRLRKQKLIIAQSRAQAMDQTPIFTIANLNSNK